MVQHMQMLEDLFSNACSSKFSDSHTASAYESDSKYSFLKVKISPL